MALDADHGVSAACTLYAPHAGGLTSGAVAPGRNFNVNRLNGCCGLFRNVVVSCPVTGFRCTSPATFIRTAAAEPSRRYTDRVSTPTGADGCATYTAPSSFSARIGVSTSIDPIFDSGGHPSPGNEKDVSEPYCAVVHAPRPDPAPGFIVKANGKRHGRVLQVRRRARTGFSHACGTTIVAFKPDGDSVEDVVGCTSIDGSNGTRSQSTIGPISVVAEEGVRGFSHE